MTTAYLTTRLVAEGLGIALLPSTYVPQLTGVVTVDVADAPARIEYVIWNHSGYTPAAAAFLSILNIPAALGAE